MKFRILAFFARALPKPTLWGFFGIFLFLLVLILMVVPVFHLFDRIGELVRWEIHGGGGEIFQLSILWHLSREVRHRVDTTFSAHDGIVIILCEVAAFALASVLYWVRRGRRHPGRVPVARKEAVALLLVVILPFVLFSPLILREWKCIKAFQSEEALGRPLYFELCQLHEVGDVSTMLTRMEETYNLHQKMKSAACPSSWADYRRFATMNYGSAYFYVWIYKGKVAFEENLPAGLVLFLMAEISAGHGDGMAPENPEKWKPLGTAMAASQIPMIRACGLFLQGEFLAFSNFVHEQVAHGNQEFEPLVESVQRLAGQIQQ